MMSALKNKNQYFASKIFAGLDKISGKCFARAA
jgi:hypothetical protein